MKNIARAALVAAAITVSLVLPAGSASANINDCPKGFACGWANLSYNGTGSYSPGSMFYAASSTTEFWADRSFEDKATSIVAAGGSCKQTKFYEGTTLWGNAVSGPYLTLNSRYLVGTSWYDADLRNGGPINQKDVNFDDIISASEFTNCAF